MHDEWAEGRKPIKGKWYVYLLKKQVETNVKARGQGSRDLYVGMTNNLEKRLGEHNDNKSKATAGYNWGLHAFLQCENRSEAAAFERWLKVGDTKKKRAAFRTYCAPEAPANREQSQLLVQKALLWKASQALREGIFKGVRNVIG